LQAFWKLLWLQNLTAKKQVIPNRPLIKCMSLSDIDQEEIYSVAETAVQFSDARRKRPKRWSAH